MVRGDGENPCELSLLQGRESTGIRLVSRALGSFPCKDTEASKGIHHRGAEDTEGERNEDW